MWFLTLSIPAPPKVAPLGLYNEVLKDTEEYLQVLKTYLAFYT